MGEENMRYRYEILEKGLDDFVASLGSPAALRALKVLKFQVLALAWVEGGIWRPDVDRSLVLSHAWEDLDVALRGWGDSTLTGSIINFWTSVGEAHWAAGKAAIGHAGRQANEATPRSVARRYLLQYRITILRTPDDGFDLPSIVPTTGPRMREWAVQQDLDPDQVESKMALIEEYERLGLINLGTPSSTPAPTRSHLRLVGSDGSE